MHPNARPWLYGIAANLLRHHHREERRRLMAYARTGIDPVTDDMEPAESRADALAAGPRIALALASLPRGDRDALLLFAWEQLTYEEILEPGSPVAIRSRLNRRAGASANSWATSGNTWSGRLVPT
jgi:RNA polymerase sigma-70 factor (ECF subfamily)